MFTISGFIFKELFINRFTEDIVWNNFWQITDNHAEFGIIDEILSDISFILKPVLGDTGEDIIHDILDRDRCWGRIWEISSVSLTENLEDNARQQ